MFRKEQTSRPGSRLPSVAMTAMLLMLLHKEKGLERPNRETIERTDYSEEHNSADEQASYAGLHKRLPQLKGMASKQGVIANASNQ